MRSSSFALAVTLFFVPLTFSQQHHHNLTDQEIGSVHFPTSCQPELASSFNRAVALLHSFQYEQARQGFTEIAVRDPQCAMAYWGVAMSHYHGLWENGDTAAGLAALNQAKQIAAGNARMMPCERAYIDARLRFTARTEKTHMSMARPLNRRWRLCRLPILKMMKLRFSTR